MTALQKLTVSEFRLLSRDRASMVLTFLLPLGLLLGFGASDGMREPLPELDGLTAFDAFIVPIALVLVVTMLLLQVFPVTLATYRERGVLRRLRTTPVPPTMLLAAQLLVHTSLLVSSLGLTAIVARLVFDVATPRHAGLALAALAMGALALYGLGTAIASQAAKASSATALGMAAFFPQLLLGGLMVPADQLPDLLARIGEFTPVGATMATLQAAWTGTDLSPRHLVVLAVWIVATAAFASIRFRWD